MTGSSSRTYLYVGSNLDSRAVAAPGSAPEHTSAGIRVLEVVDDALRPRSSVGGVAHPSFVAIHPDGTHLYAVSEIAELGAVVAYDIDAANGSLSEVDRASSHGAAPCHLSADPLGRSVLVANYLSGSVVALGLTPNGRFSGSAHPKQHLGDGPHSRQEGPHVHCALADAAGRWMYAVDLGIDRIVRYDPGPTGTELRRAGETTVAIGSGPRHLAFHPTLPVAFLVGELDNTLTMFLVDPDTGSLTGRGTVTTLPDDVDGASLAASILVTLAGDRVYVSNRGHDSIAAFEFVDVDTPPRPLGHVPCGGRTPRHLALHPSGHTMVVANQGSDTVVGFDVETSDGLPRPNGLTARVPRPAGLAFTTVGS